MIDHDNTTTVGPDEPQVDIDQCVVSYGVIPLSPSELANWKPTVAPCPDGTIYHNGNPVTA